MQFKYINQLFQVGSHQGARHWIAGLKSGKTLTLTEYCDALGTDGWELVSFTVESMAHHERLMYVGYQNSTPSSARAIFKKRVE